MGAPEQELSETSEGRGVRRARTRRPRCILHVVWVVLLLVPARMFASDGDARASLADPGAATGTCAAWAAIAARESRVPVRLMQAIATVESGRRNAEAPERSQAAWPWTVGTPGGGRWFATQKEARAFARARIAAGDAVDIGCFQLNHRWHGRAFESLDAMFAPHRNARYAARFLAALHAEFGDWTRAAAAYHSRSPELGNAYVTRLAMALDELPESDGVHAMPDGREAPRVRYGPAGPLTQSPARAGQASPTAPGSLVVAGAQGRPLIAPSDGAAR